MTKSKSDIMAEKLDPVAFMAAAYELAGPRPRTGREEPPWNIDLFEVERRALALIALEPLARQHYEASRKVVSGRPPWEKLDPNDAYDMGMRATAYEKAAEQVKSGASA